MTEKTISQILAEMNLTSVRITGPLSAFLQPGPLRDIRLAEEQGLTDEALFPEDVQP